MKVWKVRLYFSACPEYEVEAHSEDQAEDKAIELLEDDVGGIRIDVEDAVVRLSDCQYTDAQELEDRERDWDRREGLN